MSQPNHLQQSWQNDQQLSTQIQLSSVQQPKPMQKNQYYHQNKQIQADSSEDQNQLQQTQKQNSKTDRSSGSVQLYQPEQKLIQRKKYGNMIIFYESRKFLLSLGPNYLFFGFAYLSFTLATVYLVGLANSTTTSSYFKIINFIICWGQNLSYILVALSNPGVVLPNESLPLSSQQMKQNRYCKTCLVIQQRKTYHCRECNVCISEYDHHCPWTSKCIGGGNLKRFYFFVIMTPLYIFYFMFTFMYCMANITFEHNKNLKVHSNIATF